MLRFFKKIKSWLFFKKHKELRKKDLISLCEFQKLCEDNPIYVDTSYLERIHEVFK